MINTFESLRNPHVKFDFIVDKCSGKITKDKVVELGNAFTDFLKS